MLDAKVPEGPIEKKWDQRRFEMKLVNPRQPAEVSHRGRRLGAGRRRRGGHAGRAGLPCALLLLPRLARAAPTPSPPRAGSTPPRTTATTATASTACSTTPSRAATSAPARPTSTGWPSSASTSSTSASPRACRSPGSTAGCSTPAPSAAPRSSGPSTPAARPASNSCSAPTRRWSARSPPAASTMHPHTEMLDLVVVDGKARGIVTRDLVTGEVRSHAGRRRGAGHRRLRQRLLPVHQRQGLQHHRHLAGPPPGRDVRQPVLHPDPPDVHPGHGRPPVEADADVGVAPQRRPRLGAPEGRRHPPARPDPRERARLLPGAALPELRQPRAPRRRLARRQGGLRRRPRRRPGRPRRLPRLPRRHRPAGTGAGQGELRQPLRDVRADHRRGPATRCRCGSTRPCTTRWAACGSTTT